MTNLLLVGGTLSIVASIAHLGIIFGGAWYRFFGAGDKMVQMSQKGMLFPSVITFFIAAALAIWGLYAFSAAGVIRTLPFLKTITTIIALIYTLRGLLIFPALILNEGLKGWNGMDNTFWIWSSLISLTIGLFYFIGLTSVWSKI